MENLPKNGPLFREFGRASECLRTLGQCPQEILDFDKTHRKFILCELHIFVFVVISLERFDECALIAVA